MGTGEALRESLPNRRTVEQSHVPVTLRRYDTLVPPSCWWYRSGVVATHPAIDMLCRSILPDPTPREISAVNKTAYFKEFAQLKDIFSSAPT